MNLSSWAMLGALVLVGVMMSKTKRSQLPQERRSASGQGPSKPLYNASRLTVEQAAMADMIRLESETAGIDPAFMIALAVTESSLNPLAIGDDGLSFGLFQLNKKFHPLPADELLSPLRNTDEALVEMLALMRRFPGNSFADYAEAWTLGGSGRFVKKRRNPNKVVNMERAIDDLSMELDLQGVP